MPNRHDIYMSLLDTPPPVPEHPFIRQRYQPDFGNITPDRPAPPMLSPELMPVSNPELARRVIEPPTFEEHILSQMPRFEVPEQLPPVAQMQPAEPGAFPRPSVYETGYPEQGMLTEQTPKTFGEKAAEFFVPPKVFAEEKPLDKFDRYVNALGQAIIGNVMGRTYTGAALRPELEKLSPYKTTGLSGLAEFAGQITSAKQLLKGLGFEGAEGKALKDRIMRNAPPWMASGALDAFVSGIVNDKSPQDITKDVIVGGGKRAAESVVWSGAEWAVAEKLWPAFKNQFPEIGKMVDDFFTKKPKTGTSEQSHQTARKEVMDAWENYQTTGDRTQWDAIRAKYTGAPASQAPIPTAPTVTADFGKNLPVKPMAKIPVQPVVPEAKPAAPVEAKPAEAPKPAGGGGKVYYRSSSFNSKYGMNDRGNGVFFGDDIGLVNNFGSRAEPTNIYSAKLTYKKPYYMTWLEIESYAGKPKGQKLSDLIVKLKKEGYDAIVENNEPLKGTDEYQEPWQVAVFNESQIKPISSIKGIKGGGLTSPQEILQALQPPAQPAEAKQPAGGEGKGETGIEISETVLGGDSIGLDVKKNNKLIAEMTFSIGKDGVAKIGFIKALGGRGTLSVADLKEAQRQAKEKFPQITKFVGDRVTKEALQLAQPAEAKQAWEMTKEEFTKQPLVREVGIDISGKYLHGTEKRNIKTLAKPRTPEQKAMSKGQTGLLFGKDLNEFGAELFLAESENPRQSLQFARGPKRGLSIVELKSGSKILDLSDEASRAPLIALKGEPSILRFFRRPAIADDFIDWYKSKVSEGYKERNPDWETKIENSFNPTSANFDINSWKENLVKYAKEKGWDAIRFADETLLVNRDAIKSTRPAKYSEVSGAIRTAESPKYPSAKIGTLFTDKPSGAYSEVHKQRVQQAHAEGKPVPANVLAEYGLKAEGAKQAVQLKEDFIAEQKRTADDTEAIEKSAAAADAQEATLEYTGQDMQEDLKEPPPELPKAEVVKEEVEPKEPVGIQSLPINEIKADPQRFQYKLDSTGPGGVSSKMATVGTWNPKAAGVVLIWQDKEGNNFVVDGHHRLALAKKLGVESINAYVVKEADGVSESDARAMGAMSNLADEKGTAVDAAKLFRESKIDLARLRKEGVDIESQVVKQGLDIKNLSDEVFRMVIDGKVPANMAAQIGRYVSNPVQQMQVANMIAEGKVDSAKQAEFLAKTIDSAPILSKSEQTLFGTETTEKSLYAERAKILANIEHILKTNKKVFGVLSAKAGIIEKAGNILAKEENVRLKERADEILWLLEKLINQKGPISESLNEATKQYAANPTKQNLADVSRELIDKWEQDLTVEKVGKILPRISESSGEEIEKPEQKSLFRKTEPGFAAVPEVIQKAGKFTKQIAYPAEEIFKSYGITGEKLTFRAKRATERAKTRAAKALFFTENTLKGLTKEEKTLGKAFSQIAYEKNLEALKAQKASPQRLAHFKKRGVNLRAAPLSGKQAQAAEKLLDYIDSFRNEYEKAGGKLMRYGIAWPQRFTKEGEKLYAEINAMVGPDGVPDWKMLRENAMIKEMIETGAAEDVGQAYKLIRNIKNADYHPVFGYFEKAKSPIPPKYLQFNAEKVLNKGFWDRLFAHLELTKEFGSGYTLAYDYIHSIKNMYGESAGNTVQQWWDNLIRKPTEKPEWQKTLDKLAYKAGQYQTLKLSPFTSVQNYFQRFLTAMDFGIIPTAKGVIGVYRKGERLKASETGAVPFDPFESGIMADIKAGEGFNFAKIWIDAIGMGPTEKGNNITSAIAAQSGIIRDLEELATKRSTAGQIAKNILSLGGQSKGAIKRRLIRHDINWRKALQRGYLTTEELEIASIRQAESKQFRADLFSTPLWWQKSAWARQIFGKYRIPFAYNMLGKCWKLSATEAAKGNLRPLLALLIVTTISGEVYNLWRKALLGESREDMPIIKRLWEDVVDGGAVALFSTFMYGRTFAEVAYNSVTGVHGGTAKNITQTAQKLKDAPEHTPRHILDFIEKEIPTAKYIDQIMNRSEHIRQFNRRKMADYEKELTKKEGELYYYYDDIYDSAIEEDSGTAEKAINRAIELGATGAGIMSAMEGRRPSKAAYEKRPELLEKLTGEQEELLRNLEKEHDRAAHEVRRLLIKKGLLKSGEADFIMREAGTIKSDKASEGEKIRAIQRIRNIYRPKKD